MLNYTDINIGDIDQIKNDIKSKGYSEYYIVAGVTVEQFAKEFISFIHKSPKKWYADFNGHIIFSDELNLTEDNIVKFITGLTIAEHCEANRKWIEDKKRKEEQWKTKIPKKTKQYIEEGHKIIDQQFWDKWDKCVPIHLNGLYHGMELNCTLEIIKMIKNKKDFKEIYQILENQGHSYMSFQLIKFMINSFGGHEFIDWVEEYEKQNSIINR